LIVIRSFLESFVCLPGADVDDVYDGRRFVENRYVDVQRGRDVEDSVLITITKLVQY